MNGKNIILSFDGEPIAASVQASISLRQEAEEYSPLPGTVDDDGWARFRPGRLSWDLGNEGFYTSESKQFFDSGIQDETNLFDVDVNINSIHLKGVGHYSKLSINAPVKNLCKMNADFVGDNFPTIS